MSWWTKNRKKILAGGGLLALNLIPGVGQAIAGALGMGAAPGAAAAGAGGAATGLLGTGTSLAGTGLAAEGALGSGLSLAGTGLGASAAPMAAPASFMNAGLLGSGPEALSTMSSAAPGFSLTPAKAGLAMQAMGMMAPQPAPQPGPSPFQPPPPQEASPYPYGGKQDILAMLRDPTLPPEKRRQLMAMLSQRGGLA